MLITELKQKDIIKNTLGGKVFILVCHGCKEIHFPEKEADALIAELTADGVVVGTLVTDYICNVENLKLRLQKQTAVQEADTILVLSCGVGVQTVADQFPTKRVCAGCDTYALPGFQGVNSNICFCKPCFAVYLLKLSLRPTISLNTALSVVLSLSFTK